MKNGEKQAKKISFLTRIGLGEEKHYLLENISMMIYAGMNILTALDAIKRETHTRQMRKIVERIKVDVSNGVSLWQSFENTGLFKSHVISLLRVGEESGQLPENLKVIVAQQRKEKDFRSKVRSATAYPIFVLIITLVVGVGITWFILPKLASVFERMNIELPLMTKILISSAKFMQTNGIVAVPIASVMLIVILFLFFGYNKTKFLGQAFLLKIPGIKNMLKEVELANFGFSLGTMLNAGLPIDYALKALCNTTSLVKYRKMYIHLSTKVSEGNSLQKSISTYPGSLKKIPGPVQQMISVAEESGYLPKTLIDIGTLFEEKLDATTKNLTALLEPALLFIVWGAVVFIAVGVISPIYKLIGNVNPTPKSSQSRPIKQNSNQDKDTKNSAAAKSPGTITVKTTLSQVNVYNKPAKSGKILKYAKNGENYSYKKNTKSWTQIFLSDKTTGWIESKFIKVQP